MGTIYPLYVTVYISTILYILMFNYRAVKQAERLLIALAVLSKDLITVI